MKFKYMLFGMLILLIIYSIIFMTSSIEERNRIIYVKSIPSFESKMNKSEEKIKKIKNNLCQKSLNAMLNRIKDTYYDENVSIKEYVDSYTKDNLNFIDYYNKVVEDCNIKKSNTDEIYNLALSSIEYPLIKENEYSLSYEYKIKDSSSYDLRKREDEIGTYSTKNLEIKVLESLIKEAK